MATTIDALVVTLGLDPSQFTQAQREAVEAFKKTQGAAVAGGKEIDAQGKKTSEFFSTMKREALGLLGVFFAGKGIKDFIGHITALDASTSRMAAQFHVSQDNLLAWRNVMKQVGGEAEVADAAIGGLSDAMQDFLLNPGSANPALFGALARVGVKPEDYTDPLAILHGMARLSQTPEFKNDEPHFRAEAKLLGITDPSMISALFEGDSALNKRLANAHAALGHPNSAEAKEFQTSLALMQGAAEGLARSMLGETGLIGALTKLMEAVTKLKEGVLPDWLKEILDWSRGKMLPDGVPVIPPEERGLGPVPVAQRTHPAARKLLEVVFGPDTVAKTGELLNQPSWGKSPGIEMLVGVGAAAAATSRVNSWHSRQRSSSFSSAVHINHNHMHMPGARDGADAARNFRDELQSMSGANTMSAFPADSGAH